MAETSRTHANREPRNVNFIKTLKLLSNGGVYKREANCFQRVGGAIFTFHVYRQALSWETATSHNKMYSYRFAPFYHVGEHFYS